MNRYELHPYGLAITVSHDVFGERRRTLRERWLTWPWRPWKATEGNDRYGVIDKFVRRAAELRRQ